MSRRSRKRSWLGGSPGTGPSACPGRGGRLRLPHQGAIRVCRAGRVFGRSAGAMDHPGPAGRGSPGTVRRSGCRRGRAAADGHSRPCAGARLLSRMGPGPRSAYRFQRHRVRRLLDRLSLARRVTTSGCSASRGPDATGRHRFVPLGFLPLTPVPLRPAGPWRRAAGGWGGRSLVVSAMRSRCPRSPGAASSSCSSPDTSRVKQAAARRKMPVQGGTG